MVERSADFLDGTDDLNCDDQEVDEIQQTWQRLFLLLTSIAKDEGIDVDEATSSGMLEINEDNTFELRINPAIHDISGNLETLSLNLYHEGTHVQQVIAKAKWENETPEITDIDNDPIEGPFESLGLVEIAFCAETLLNRVNIDTDHADIPKGAIFPTPDSSSELLN